MVLFLPDPTLAAAPRNGPPHEAVTVVLKAAKTHAVVQADGSLQVNLAAKEVRKWKARKFLTYRDLGATGDGKANDMDAIAATHAAANHLGLPVKADSEATYYIGGNARTAVVRTPVDFGAASFIIDDTAVENRNAHVFLVRSDLNPVKLEGVTSLKRNQDKLDLDLPGTCLVTVTDDHVKRYIRMGANQNSGAPQTDAFIADKDGRVDMRGPIIWDFGQITGMTALPIDSRVLTLSGGRFTTIANQAESKYTYYKRGIGIRRSNVVVDRLEHRVTGEGDHGAPYGGFIDIGDCARVTVSNSILTGHKTYVTIGAAGVPVPMGSYDINVNRAIGVSFVNVRQTNDINDRSFWGIMGSNHSKDLLYDQCVLSRFDAHMGVANATIRRSILGHQGINAIGSGTFTVEDSTIRGGNLISLRSDYGSAWQGGFVIRNCVFIPAGGNSVANVHLIGGSNNGLHDFGYSCSMPERILIENLRIDDAHHRDDYPGPAVLANFNPQMKDGSFTERFPYLVTKEIIIRKVTIASGKPLRLSENPYMFRNVKMQRRRRVRKSRCTSPP